MKFYYTLTMSWALFWLGDLVSKPLNWSWANSDEDNKFIEWLVHINYSTYNWLMLKSCDYNDAGGHDLWGPVEYDEMDDNDEEDAFTPVVFTKKDQE